MPFEAETNCHVLQWFYVTDTSTTQSCVVSSFFGFTLMEVVWCLPEVYHVTPTCVIDLNWRTLWSTNFSKTSHPLHANKIFLFLGPLVATWTLYFIFTCPLETGMKPHVSHVVELLRSGCSYYFVHEMSISYPSSENAEDIKIKNVCCNLQFKSLFYKQHYINMADIFLTYHCCVK